MSPLWSRIGKVVAAHVSDANCCFSGWGVLAASAERPLLAESPLLGGLALLAQVPP